MAEIATLGIEIDKAAWDRSFHEFATEEREGMIAAAQVWLQAWLADQRNAIPAATVKVPWSDAESLVDALFGDIPKPEVA
jgi:hypothetical protein